MKKTFIGTWKGKEIDETTPVNLLLEIITYMSGEIERLQQNRLR